MDLQVLGLCLLFGVWLMICGLYMVKNFGVDSKVVIVPVPVEKDNSKFKPVFDVIVASKYVFDVIVASKYDKQTNNCVKKSEWFAEALKNGGATDVYLLEITSKDGRLGHMVVQWYDRIYDPTKGVWCMNKSEYLAMMKRDYGLDGLKYSYKV